MSSSLFRALAALLLAPAPLLAQAGEAAEPPPNILLFLVDDLGWADLGCQGSDFYETPHIDRLAAQGMRFTQAYSAAAVCSPSRASLLTGKSPARLHLTDYIPGRRYPRAPLRPPEFAQALTHEEQTLAEALGARGYRTLHVGKWHLGREPHWPTRQGFDANVGGHDKGMPGSYFHPYARANDQADWTVLNLPPGGREGDYLTERLTDEALRLLEQERGRPFFLYMSYYTVHTPIQGKPELLEKYRRKRETAPAGGQRNAGYAAMVQSLDESVGRLLGALDALGLADNTLVVFTSDNGGLAGVTSNHPLRLGKGWLYEGGIRVPLLVRWPGVVAPGSTCSAPVTGTDLFPTLVAAAGGQPPQDGAGALDGIDLAPSLRDASRHPGREALYWHYPHYHTPQKAPSGAVRAGDWKLIDFYENGRTELYDLGADPGETHDLAAERPELAAALHGRLHAWLEEAGAAMPARNPDHDPEAPFEGAYTAWPK